MEDKPITFSHTVTGKNKALITPNGFEIIENTTSDENSFILACEPVGEVIFNGIAYVPKSSLNSLLDELLSEARNNAERAYERGKNPMNSQHDAEIEIKIWEKVRAIINNKKQS